MDAVVYFNWGRWVADCPTPSCSNAEEYGRGLTDGSMVCSFCHRMSKVVWPDDRAAIEKVLNGRPVPSTRNWTSDESVEQLTVENIEHGVI